MAKAKPTYFCVVMPTPGARNEIGAVYGCSTKASEAERVLKKAHKRGMTSLRIATTPKRQARTKGGSRWSGLDGAKREPPPVYHPRQGPPPGVYLPPGVKTSLKGRSRRKR